MMVRNQKHLSNQSQSYQDFLKFSFEMQCLGFLYFCRMLAQFNDYIEQHSLIPEKGKVIIAISGGADSVVMTDLFVKHHIDVVLAHCNFHLRGSESDADEQFVRKLAKDYDVELRVKSFDTQQEIERRKDSLQMVARDLRFEWFDELLEEYANSVVAAGHHQDDQIETFFNNLTRGTGIAGLHGILPQQGRIIHPMLFATREQIERYAQQNALAYRDDSSNASVKYKRNKIRHQLLPVLQQIEPNYQKILSKNIQRFRKAERLIEDYVELMMSQIITQKEKAIQIEKNALQENKKMQDVFSEWLLQYGFNEDVIMNINTSLGGISGKQFFSETHRLTIDRECLIIDPRKPIEFQEYMINDGLSEVEMPIRLKIKKQPFSKDVVIVSNKRIAMLDYDKLCFPLVLRKWKKGDWFMPFGRKNKKKISDFFIDQKFAIPEKENTWLLTSAEEVVWIVGHRIDHRYRLQENTKLICRIELDED